MLYPLYFLVPAQPSYDKIDMLYIGPFNYFIFYTKKRHNATGKRKKAEKNAKKQVIFNGFAYILYCFNVFHKNSTAKKRFLGGAHGGINAA